ncbi:hypothetical protein [Pseudomonas oryzihabitans]|uniref:hypothetical protein n=1 Tax=Pseudomonas oryzihabitans TaxID=47885 RepID=UPI003EBA0B02
MSDLLSAASLLMAISAILFSLWYGEISQTLEITPKPHKQDNAAALESTKKTFKYRALPILITSTGITAIFLPDAIKIALNTIHTHADPSIEFEYSAIHTAYCFVTILSLFLSLYTAKISLDLKEVKKALS